MLYSFIHPGSGLGNQLFRIVAGKVLALDKGFEYSAIGRNHFKGKGFMNIDFGLDNQLAAGIDRITGKLSIAGLGEEPFKYKGFEFPRIWEEKTNYYNPEINFIEDNTIIDGEFQDPKYFEHRIDEINTWLSPNMAYAENPDHCVIGFRGGEFYQFPELGLPKSYFEEGIRIMREINPKMKFQVQTDDPALAKEFFPDFEIVSDIAINWNKVRCFRYAIIANSSFYILPRLLKHNDKYYKDYEGGQNKALTIAPRYWARRNTGEWSMPQNYYKQFMYV